MADKSDPIPQSAVLAYRRNRTGIQYLLITSLDTRRWVLPKGHIPHGMSPRESAEKEAFEEAGIRGKTGSKSIGTFDYVKPEEKGSGLRRVAVYPMEVKTLLDTWPEKRTRRRLWMSPRKAASKVAEKKLRKIILSFTSATLKENA